MAGQTTAKERTDFGLKKKTNDRTLITIIPTKSGSLPKGTLSAILGPKQTKLGNEGLLKLLKK